MASPNPQTPIQALNAKLTGEDVEKLDRLRALALLRRWDGEWSGSRGDCVRALMDKLESLLPVEERDMLSAA